MKKHKHVRKLTFALIGAIAMLMLLGASDSENKTRLRASKAKGTFVTRNYTKLTRVETKVRNVGDTEARNVVITATTPAGNNVILSGPSSLAPNKSYTYSLSLSEVVTSTKRIAVKADCDNCYH